MHTLFGAYSLRCISFLVHILFGNFQPSGEHVPNFNWPFPLLVLSFEDTILFFNYRCHLADRLANWSIEEIDPPGMTSFLIAFPFGYYFFFSLFPKTWKQKLFCYKLQPAQPTQLVDSTSRRWFSKNKPNQRLFLPKFLIWLLAIYSEHVIYVTTIC